MEGIKEDVSFHDLLHIPSCRHLPCTSIFSPGSILPLFGLTQYCFGAVVLTLKATGWLLGLETCSVRLTSWVSGRGNPS